MPSVAQSEEGASAKRPRRTFEPPVDDLAKLAKILKVSALDLASFTGPLDRRYRRVPHRKKSGKIRLLHVPDAPLALLQTKIKEHIIDKAALPDWIHGGVRHRSARTNAKVHAGQPLVFCLDVQDFYPSVKADRVKAVFMALGFEGEALQFLVHITTVDGRLPQGTSTSPGLANLTAISMDRRITALAAKHGFKYTRFVDDLTISGNRRLCNFRKLIQKIVEQEGFRANEAKRATMSGSSRQIVTGIVVNTKPNLPKETRKAIRKQVGLELMAMGARSKSTEGLLAWARYVNPDFARSLQHPRTKRISNE